jgi:Protein of unknown function (DUF2752)
VRLSRSAQISRYCGLGICAVPLIGSWFYAAGYRTSLLFCPLRHWLGFICPSCGMTRSFGSFVRGNWLKAIEYHLFGPPLFILFGLILVHLIWELISGCQQPKIYLNWIFNLQIQRVIGIIFLVYYLLRLNSIISISAL